MDSPVQRSGTFPGRFLFQSHVCGRGSDTEYDAGVRTLGPDDGSWIGRNESGSCGVPSESFDKPQVRPSPKRFILNFDTCDTCVAEQSSARNLSSRFEVELGRTPAHPLSVEDRGESFHLGIVVYPPLSPEVGSATDGHRYAQIETEPVAPSSK